MRYCDGKFTDEDLNEEGNEFAAEYFDHQKGGYLADYEATLGEDVPDLYHVYDTWQNYENLKQVLDDRLSEWRSKRG